MLGPALVDTMIEKRSGGDEHQQPYVPCFKKGEFPPPLPSLARTSYNHLPLQVPWTLLQAKRSNNRVVLHEIKAANGAHLMLFQPIRSRGRLILNMLRHDSDDELAEETETSDHEEDEIVLPSSLSSGGAGVLSTAASTASAASSSIMDSEVE